MPDHSAPIAGKDLGAVAGSCAEVCRRVRIELRNLAMYSRDAARPSSHTSCAGHLQPFASSTSSAMLHLHP